MPAVTHSRLIAGSVFAATLSIASAAQAEKVYLSKLDYFSESRITRFLETTLPAGTYLVTAKGTMNSAAYGGCNIVSGPESFQTYHNGSDYDNNTKSQAQIMIAKVTLPTSANVAIRCGNGFGVSWTITQPVLVAVPVAADKE
jgi:hypothetical protein